MDWIEETYSEETDDLILSQSNDKIIVNVLCEHIRQLESKLYQRTMTSLGHQRTVLKLKKELKNN